MFRGIDKSTDVLAFPEDNDPTKSKLTHIQSLGEILISPEYACKNAKKIGSTLGEEICFLIVHGLLHLLGYDHEQVDERKHMNERQKELILNLKNELDDKAISEIIIDEV